MALFILDEPLPSQYICSLSAGRCAFMTSVAACAADLVTTRKQVCFDNLHDAGTL